MTTHLRLIPGLFVLLAVLSGCGPRLAAPEPIFDDRFSEAMSSYESGRFYEAKIKFESIRFDYPGHARIGEVQFYIALCFYQIREHLNAEQEFRAFLREFPAGHAFADDAMYWLCKTLSEMALPARLEQSDTRKAIEETENFEETYPESEYLPEVRRIKSDSYDRLAEKEYLAGRLYRRMGYTSAAIHYFRELEKDFPESRWLARSRYEWALCLYKQGDFADARSMADTSRLRLQAVIVREQDRFVTDVRRGFAYRLFHLFGAIPYETRTPIKIYIDELDTDISNLMRRIDHKLEATALKPGADSGS